MINGNTFQHVVITTYHNVNTFWDVAFWLVAEFVSIHQLAGGSCFSSVGKELCHRGELVTLNSHDTQGVFGKIDLNILAHYG